MVEEESRSRYITLFSCASSVSSIARVCSWWALLAATVCPCTCAERAAYLRNVSAVRRANVHALRKASFCSPCFTINAATCVTYNYISIGEHRMSIFRRIKFIIIRKLWCHISAQSF